MLSSFPAFAALLLAPLAATEDSGLVWEAIADLAPSEIGALALQGHDHREIVQVERNSGGMLPPGMILLELYEKAERVDQHCERGVWHATFIAQRSSGTSGAALQPGLYRSQEVSLPRGRDCAETQFTRVGTGLDPQGGVQQLLRLDAFFDGETSFTCVDRTPSKLCVQPGEVRSALKSLPVWHVQYDEERQVTEYWLRPSATAPNTTVTIPVERSRKVVIERAFPPPF